MVKALGAGNVVTTGEIMACILGVCGAGSVDRAASYDKSLVESC